MKKLTFLWMAIGCLFLLNIGTLALLFLDRRQHEGPPAHPRRFDQTLISTLQLDAAQIEQFNLLKRAHHERIVQLDELMRAPVETYFERMLVKKDSTGTAMLEKQISELYLDKLRVTWRHFEDIRELCTPEQQADFPKLLPKMMQVMHPGPPKRD